MNAIYVNVSAFSSSMKNTPPTQAPTQRQTGNERLKNWFVTMIKTIHYHPLICTEIPGNK